MSQKPPRSPPPQKPRCGIAAYAGEDVFRALTGRLLDRDALVRTSAGQAISTLLEWRNWDRSVVPGETVSTLIGRLKESVPSVRLWAARALGQIGAPSEQAVLSLVRMLGDPEPGVRAAAAGALGRIGIADKGVVPALVVSLDDREMGRPDGYGEREVRYEAAEALRRLGPAANVVVAPLMARLRDRDLTFRYACARALGKTRVLSDRDARALLGLLRNEDRDVWGAAAVAFWGVSPEVAQRFVPDLARLLHDPDTFEAGARALSGLGPAAKGALPELVKGLREGPLLNRMSAAYAIAMMGPAAEKAIADLSKLLKDRNAVVRRAAAEALRLISGGPQVEQSRRRRSNTTAK